MPTIQDCITTARFQLQDETTGAYRYSDDKFVMGLNAAFDDAYRIRPDFFIRIDQPVIIGAALTTDVPIPRGYFMAFIFYMAGFVQMSDQEDTSDARSSIMLNKFIAQLTTPQS